MWEPGTQKPGELASDLSCYVKQLGEYANYTSGSKSGFDPMMQISIKENYFLAKIFFCLKIKVLYIKQ